MISLRAATAAVMRLAHIWPLQGVRNPRKHRRGDNHYPPMAHANP